MALLPSSSLMFTVRRCQPELVPPAAPTPREVKILSDIDDQKGIRYNIPITLIYRHEPSMTKKDPLKVLRHALSQALVYYYPLAGRIRERVGEKLMVDCTGEGVMFIEAEANVTLDEFGDALHPPFPCIDELLYDDPDLVLNIERPIRLIQVTRLKCGGFILVVSMNHTMIDGAGLKQFLNAWTEMARGARKPSIQPVWRRELLMARDPPRITCNHREYEHIPPNTSKVEDTTSTILQSFFFTAAHIDAIRCLVPFHLRQCTTFELITACFWHCRTKALQIEHYEEVRMMFPINARSRFSSNHTSFVGYYGNCFALVVAITTAGKLCENPLGFAVELIRKAKYQVTEEHMHSVADFMVINERRVHTLVRSCIVSVLTHVNYREVNFGWGDAKYAGVAKGGAGVFPAATIMVPYKNEKQEDGLILPISLPYEDMKRFAKELDEMLGNHHPTRRGHRSIMSSL